MVQNTNRKFILLVIVVNLKIIDIITLVIQMLVFRTDYLNKQIVVFLL